MTGASFCKAAEDAFFLNLRNAVRLGIVHGLGYIFTFIAEISITIGTATLAHFMFNYIEYYQANLFNPIIPTLVI